MTSLTAGKDRQPPDVKKPTEVGSFTPAPTKATGSDTGDQPCIEERPTTQ